MPNYDITEEQIQKLFAPILDAALKSGGLQIIDHVQAVRQLMSKPNKEEKALPEPKKSKKE